MAGFDPTLLHGRIRPVDLPGEGWMPIPGYEGRYDVSDMGRVRSYVGGGGRIDPVPILMRQSSIKPRGYFVVRLYSGKAGASTGMLVHRLVLFAFVGPPPESQKHACHGNDNPTDNRLSNLRWGSQSENVIDAYRNARAGVRTRGAGQHLSKITDDDVREMRRLHAGGMSYGKLARAYKMSAPNVASIIKRRTWKHVS